MNKGFEARFIPRSYFLVSHERASTAQLVQGDPQGAGRASRLQGRVPDPHESARAQGGGRGARGLRQDPHHRAHRGVRLPQLRVEGVSDPHRQRWHPGGGPVYGAPVLVMCDKADSEFCSQSRRSRSSFKRSKGTWCFGGKLVFDNPERISVYHENLSKEDK